MANQLHIPSKYFKNLEKEQKLFNIVLVLVYKICFNHLNLYNTLMSYMDMHLYNNFQRIPLLFSQKSLKALLNSKKCNDIM